jgi:hypothetical protein
VRAAQPAVSAECGEDTSDVPAEDVRGEPESIVVEPNLHLAENDGNRFELFISSHSGEDGSFAIQLQTSLAIHFLSFVCR